ncbi:serine/threonine protein kinase, CMGC, CDC2/CDK sub [Serendipita sp. 399]|nr:serine/threonine protein kinase, CMGC, CDC2/CDK sub [Serendipita sp. 399]
MNSPLKRPHSPDHSSRRVRQRVEKRAETPEEGEVEEGSQVQAELSEKDVVSGPVGDSNAGSNESQPPPPARSKVAFPFNNRAKKVQSIPKVDLVNGAPPAKRITPSPPHSIATSHHSGDRGGRASEVPPPGRGEAPRIHEVKMDTHLGEIALTPIMIDEDPGQEPHRMDIAIDEIAMSQGEIITIVGEQTIIDRGTLHPEVVTTLEKERILHKDINPGHQFGGTDLQNEIYRVGHFRLPVCRSGAQEELIHIYHLVVQKMVLETTKEEALQNRDQPLRLIDRISAPGDITQADHTSPRGTPPPPTTAPPPLPEADTRLNRPLAVHPLPPRPVDPLSHVNNKSSVIPERPTLPPRDVYFANRVDRAPPPPPPSVPPPLPSEAPHPPPRNVPTPSKERNNESKPSAHKVANVRSKEEEAAAYDREFKGSGRINEYILMQKLGEGTFGEVHQARPRDPAKSGMEDLALKRIIMHSEKEGMPITALREIKILKALSHPNIVKVLDIVVMPRTPKDAGSVYVVFPYMDHDLAGLLENKSVQLSQSHIKLYMKQLLEGVEYMHDNHIIHRDIKAANILVSNEGVLQIADFGLARPYIKKTKMERIDKHLEKYTNCVVTRWYRPPELLMGERYYGPEIDLWGVGCIVAEMFLRRPIFQGSSDMDQLEKIWWLCGTPTPDLWPDFGSLPGLDGVKTFKPRPKELRTFLNGQCPSMTDDTFRLIDALLTLDPSKRPTASAALLYDYFWTSPLPADPKTVPKFEPSHELDRRKKAPPPAPPPNPHHHYPSSHGPPFNSNGMGRNNPLPMRLPHPHGLPMPPQMHHGRMNNGLGPGPGPGPGPMGNNVPPMNMHGHPPPPSHPSHLPFPPHMHNGTGGPSGQPHPLPPPPLPPPSSSQVGPNGLPIPRGFRGPPRNHQHQQQQHQHQQYHHSQHQNRQQQYRHDLPPPVGVQGGPIGSGAGGGAGGGGGHPPPPRGPPLPPQDSMVLRYD